MVAKEQKEMWGPHGGPGAVTENPPHQGWGIIRAKTSLHHSQAGKCRGQHGSAQLACCEPLPWQTPQRPKKTDDKYNNIRCSQGGQLLAVICLHSQGPHSPKVKENSEHFDGKWLCNVAHFSHHVFRKPWGTCSGDWSHWEESNLTIGARYLLSGSLFRVPHRWNLASSLRGEILWLINCQQFITSEEPLNFLLWSHKKCQRLIRSQRASECFCSRPPLCASAFENTSASASDPHVQIRIIMCLLCSESTEGSGVD